jgi:2-haloacid dehalogenase
MAAEVLAFDVYGTLVDPLRLWTRLAAYATDTAQQIALLWRQKQLEFSFRLAAMGRYRPFDEVTALALDYALAETATSLSDADRRTLLQQYHSLDPFPDTIGALRALQQSGRTLAVFSNGNPAMLDPLLDTTGLRPLFHHVISVDEAQTYKPAPRVYRHAAERLGVPVSQVLLVSSNPFDIIGAQAVGMQAAWVNRAHSRFDGLGPIPPLVVATLTELVDRLDRVDDP